MPTIRMTLQERITTLMVVFSVLFIGAFTTIQLNNQLNNISRYNSYQANLSSIIVKNNLETIIRKIKTEDLPQYIQSSLETLAETDIIKDAIVYDRDGKIIASTATRLISEIVPYKDIAKIQGLEYISKENKWFIPEIDDFKHRLNIYISLNKGPKEIAYLAKISFSLGNIQEAFLGVYRAVLFAAVIVILTNIILGYLLSKIVIGPIKLLNEVTKLIAAGDLAVRTNIHTNDELEELGLTFNYMAEELIKMKEYAENANPLTKLPGNIVIHEKVEKRIKDNRKFVVIYCDLDNFKSFNDKYGIAKGDEAIKLTAEILKEAVKLKGNSEDFIGHEGGDDFILLTTPDKAQSIADYIIQEFDKRVRSFYEQEDLTQGYIISYARDGSVKQFPIMTISLAGVTNEHRNIISYGEVTNIAAEIKRKTKSLEGSVFAMDKRRDSSGGGRELRKDST